MNKVILHSNEKSAEYSQYIKPKDVGLRVPDDGFRYVQIKQDYEYFGEPRHRAENIKSFDLPAIVNEIRRRDDQGRDYDYVTLTDEWQWFMYSLWAWSVDNILPKGAWEDKYTNASNPSMVFDKYTQGSMLWYYAEMIQDARSHTDSESPEGGFRDVVTGRNPAARNYSWLTKTTTGNLLRVVGEDSTWWIVDTLNLTKPPPSIYDVQDKPWLIHWATTMSLNQYADKTWGVHRYPQAYVCCRYRGYADTGTPIPMVGKGGQYRILKARCKSVAAGAIYSPYNPPK